jgi:hypothetical protein
MRARLRAALKRQLVSGAVGSVIGLLLAWGRPSAECAMPALVGRYSLSAKSRAAEHGLGARASGEIRVTEPLRR